MSKTTGERDATEPELPTLPAPLEASARSGKFPSIFTRNSSCDLNFPSTSSDPPIFSSDDVPEGSENYASRRKKTSRIGPWWEPSQPPQPLQPRKKRKTERITRNLDSGVFMGVTSCREGSPASSNASSCELNAEESHVMQSPPAFAQSQPAPISRTLMVSQEMMPPPADGNYTRWGPPKDLVSSFYFPGDDQSNIKSGTSEAGLAPEHMLERGGGNKKAHLLDAGSMKDGTSSRHLRLRLSRSKSKLNKNHPARLIVDKAVETGCEDIDLSGQMVWHETSTESKWMDRPDDRIFHPLHHLVKTRAVYDPGRYDSLIPDMRLWLSDNRLEMLPNEVYRLRNLTQLSLRQNEIRSLSPSIGKLVRLQLLNLSGNPVAYLPWEITRLSSLTEIRVDVAYTYQPTTEKIIPKPAENDSMQDDQWMVEAVSLVSWLGKTGIPILNSIPRPSITSSLHPSLRTSLIREPPIDEHESRTKSLFDSCIKAMSSVPEVENLLHSHAHFLPQHCIPVLRSAYQTERVGGTTCSVCDTPFVIPRAEWIEWASRGKQIRRMPLVRTACSWNCVRQHLDDLVLPNSLGWVRGAKPTYHSGVVTNCGWR